MKNSDNNIPRKAHNIKAQTVEGDLWDLGDDLDDDPSPDSSEKENVQTEKENQASPLEPANEVSSEGAEMANENSEIETPDQDELHSEPIDEPTTELNTPSDIEAVETSDNDIVPAEESQVSADDTASPAGIKSEIAALISPLKKSSLSSAEKITLATLTIVLIGLGIWGYVFLYEKNNLAETEATLNLPVKGQYATVTKLSTYWISAGKAAGIKLGVAVVPVAKITLDDASTSGALRIFFRDAEKNRVGDPITISFQDGQFADSNKTNITIADSGSTATVSATNGFQVESAFSAYQMDSTLTWRVHVLEADSSSATGSKFEELFNTRVEPKRQ